MSAVAPSLVKLAPWIRKLRPWQEQAASVLLAAEQPDMLVDACPSSGKTMLGAFIAHRLISDGKIARVVVLAPSNNVCERWAAVMQSAGIEVRHDWTNRLLADALTHHLGIAVTYQAVIADPELHREMCVKHGKTLLICDEPHHMGERRPWADAIRAAYGNHMVIMRLLLTGTPFRTDRTPIPFVRYLERGAVHADYVYDAEQARLDKVIRKITLISWGGEARWRAGEQEIDTSFTDPLCKRDARRRLRTALTHGDWLPGLLAIAHQKLTHLRQTETPDAGGLVVCSDQAYARQAAAALTQISGRAPALAISDDPRASKTINQFGCTPYQQEWLVAVRMVSEGVDLPRVRVGVYATVTRTDLYLRQVAGRFTRMVGEWGENQDAYLYFAADPEMERMARELEAQTPLAVQVSEHAVGQSVSNDQGGEGDSFEPLASTVGEQHERIAFPVKTVPPARLQALWALQARRPELARYDATTLELAGWWRELADADWRGHSHDPDPVDALTPRDRERAVRAHLVTRYAGHVNITEREAHAMMMKRWGSVAHQSTASLKDGNESLRALCESVYRDLHDIPEPRSEDTHAKEPTA